MTEERQYVTTEEMTAPGQLAEDDVQTASGRWMRVRALSRHEVGKVQDIEDTAESEVYALSCGLLIPRMNRPQVEAMMKATGAGELNPVSVKIMQMSGLAEDAERKAVQDFETGKVSEFRVLPSGEAGPDGGGTTPHDGQ